MRIYLNSRRQPSKGMLSDKVSRYHALSYNTFYVLPCLRTPLSEFYMNIPGHACMHKLPTL